MDRVEHLSSPIVRDKRSWMTVRHVDNQTTVSDVDLSHTQAGARIVGDSVVISIERLISCHGVEIYSKMINCIYCFFKVIEASFFDRPINVRDRR